MKDDLQKRISRKPAGEKHKKPVKDTAETRLNKYVANAGICSRREADKLIAAGEIRVNGDIITQMGHKVKPADKVYYKGKRLLSERPVYVILNKPKGFITTTDDPQERRTVMELVKAAGEERIYPVGRLDRATTGLLLFTNDGDLAEKLAHPSNNVRKIYHVEIDKPITKTHLEQIAGGVTLEDGLAPVDEIAVLDSKKSLGLELHIGRNRIVRRIFEHLGYEVLKLDRVIYAGLDKLNLPRGKWRYLTEKEVRKLKRGEL